MFVIQLRPERITASGRQRGPDYLARINYPGLLTAHKPSATSTINPDDAITYSRDAAGTALALVLSIGFDSAAIVEV